MNEYPDDVDLLFLEALLRRELGDLEGAEERLRAALDLKPGGYFGSVDAGLRGYKARHNLALLLQRQGRTTASFRETSDPGRGVVNVYPSGIGTLVGRRPGRVEHIERLTLPPPAWCSVTCLVGLRRSVGSVSPPIDLTTAVARVLAVRSAGFPGENLFEPDSGVVRRTSAANPFEYILRCCEPPRAVKFGLRASVERIGEENASTRIHFGVADRSE